MAENYDINISMNDLVNADVIVCYSYLAHWLTLRPGMRVLDIGCGVGEPGRAIAQFAGCEVVGLNINGYQLQKAKVYTREEGLSHLCTYVEGDFMDMPFQDEYFDAIFSVEVICHAPDLQKAHQEVFRVLKKGGKYGFYEEGMTEKFDVSVPEHRKIRNGIERGNGIAKMPMVKEVRESVKAAGFIIEVEEDGMAKGDALPWYWPLEGKVSLVRDWHDFQVVLMLTWFIKFLQYYALWIQEIIGLQDKGRTRTLDTLHFSVNGYRDGGRLGIFTPLQMFICEKPKESLRGKGD